MASIEALQDVVARIEAAMERSAERQERTERELTEIRKRSEERKSEAERELEEIRRKRERAYEETEEIQNKIERMLEEAAEQQRKNEFAIDRLSKNVGGLNNSIGEIVEMIIIPGLKGKMNAFGHTFTIMSPRKAFYKRDGASLMEIDLLLENCEEVMAVEVKTQLSIRWVNRHLKRMELLRENQSITGVTGKTIYAAVAGVSIDDEARALAVENGMYIVEIEENEERVKIIPPEKIKKW